MATTSVLPSVLPNTSLDPAKLLQTLQAGLDIKVSGELPGEAAFVALVTFAGQVRTSMDKALVARLDAVMVQQAEDLQKVWRGIWVAMGVLQQ
jgi:hypothetical protein